MHLDSKDATIYVAGHTGLVGSAVFRALKAEATGIWPEGEAVS